MAWCGRLGLRNPSVCNTSPYTTDARTAAVGMPLVPRLVGGWLNWIFLRYRVLE